MRKFSLALGAAVLSIANCPHAGLASPTVGQPAPALRVTDLNGQPFDLSALRGKVVVVNFWATWCPPCRAEMPALNAVYRQYHDKGVEVIALSAERSRARSDVRKAMQKFVFPAAMLCDAKANGFGDPDGLPDTYVIDAQGVLRAKFLIGKPQITEKSLSDALIPLLPPEPAQKAP